ncbi:F-box/LRR-repeat protein 2 [Medicago truncatula]|nr:F-box/LRR-repeat protein 2 [Medicago truncatula]
MVDEQTNTYLPDECWEWVFGFLINKADENLSSLSLVSKQFLSITNRLQISLTLKEEARPFLPLLFKRFTHLTSLDLSLIRNHLYLDDLLCEISNFPLKLTLLKLPHRCRFPVNGLQVFSQNITTLTFLTCYGTFFCNNDLSPIVDCFPLLKQLNLHHPLVINKPNFINSIHCMLSKCPCIQHLELRSTSFLTDQLVDEMCLFFGKLVSINLSGCHHLTETTLFSLVRNCPSISEIKMEGTSIGINTLEHSGVYPQLKSLYLGRNSWLSDEIIIMYASIFPNLQLLDLKVCREISEGICEVLRKCCKLKHLNLAFCSNVKLHGMNFAVPELEVLNLSNTSIDDETFYAISKNCCRILQLLLENCKGVTMKGVKQVVENCTQLRKIKLGRFRLSDENRKLLSRHGCYLC